MLTAGVRAWFAGDERVVVDDSERRHRAFTRTVDLMRGVRDCDRWRSHPRFDGRLVTQVVVGADLVESLPQWYAARQLVEENEFLVVPRPGFSPPRALLVDGVGVRMFFVDDLARSKGMRLVQCDVSSSEVRRRVQLGADSSIALLGAVPAPVSDIIRERGLYAGGKRPPAATELSSDTAATPDSAGASESAGPAPAAGELPRL